MTIREEEFVSTLFGLKINLSPLRQAKSTTDEDYKGIGNIKCYKISVKSTENGTINFELNN